jgi:hypothetical protein
LEDFGLRIIVEEIKGRRLETATVYKITGQGGEDKR